MAHNIIINKPKSIQSLERNRFGFVTLSTGETIKKAIYFWVLCLKRTENKTKHNITKTINKNMKNKRKTEEFNLVVISDKLDLSTVPHLRKQTNSS